MLVSACNSNTETATVTFGDTDTAAVVKAEDKPAGVKIDPVCEMPQDTSWTEYTVYKGDTVKFCSDVCKGVFLKNPAKYEAKLK
ncbi:MAG: YHS domain-containing protein [Bacteroidetes bacterium]|nr:YHS domain-containing protein [Bacteroidota bacterium]